MLTIENINRYNPYNSTLKPVSNVHFGNKRYIDQDEIDEFVSETINKERIKNNGIKFYSESVSKSVLKKYCKDIKNSITQFRINDYAFFVNADKEGKLFAQKIKIK